MLGTAKIAWLGAAAFGCTLVCAMASAEPPEGPAFAELGHDIPGFDYPARAHFAVADFDGDGRDDLAFAGSTSLGGRYSSIEIAGKDEGGTVRIKQSILYYSDPSPTAMRLLVYSDPIDGVHLLSIDFEGLAREWTGWPLRETRTFPTIDAPQSAVIGDIDADGTPEIVVRSATSLAAFSLATAALKWNIPVDGGGEVMLAQLDADAALEIVLGNVAPGKILDGATLMEDWSYPDSFGAWLASGRLGNSDERAFVGAASRITVFSGSPYSPLWDYAEKPYFAVSALDVTDIDHDGTDDILYSPASAGIYAVDVLDSVTRTPKASYPYGNDDIGAIATVHLDGTNAPQIAAASQVSVGVLDPANGDVVWSAQSRSGSFSVACVGDVDGDGNAELLTSAGIIAWDRPAGLEVRDMRTGETQWISNPVDNEDLYMTAPNRIRIVDPIEPGDEKRILLAGTAWYDGRVMLIGARTHQVYLQLGEYSEGPFMMRPIKDAILADMDGDGIDDIVVASQPIFNAVSGAMLHAYSQAGNLIWQSVGMGASNQLINGVFALDASLGAGDEIVAVLPEGLRAYNRTTHLLDWTLEVQNDSALVAEHGADGAEIVFEIGNTLSFYAASTRTFLRSFTLSDPIDAVTPLDGRTDRLLVSSAGRLHLVDGMTGTEIIATDSVAMQLSNRDQLAVETISSDTWRIGAGGDTGVFRYRLALSERIFASGMEP